MARGKKRKSTSKEDIKSYGHEAETRKNAVPVGLASYDTSKSKSKKYEYNPQLMTSDSSACDRLNRALKVLIDEDKFELLIKKTNGEIY